MSRVWWVTFGVMCAFDLLLVIALTLRGRRILAERKQPRRYRAVVVDALTREAGATRHGSYFGLPVLTAEEEQEMEDARRQGVPAARFAFRLRALDNMRWSYAENGKAKGQQSERPTTDPDVTRTNTRSFATPTEN